MSWTSWMNFGEANIMNVPTQSGVYALGDGSEVIYYGKAEGEDGLRQELLAKLRDPQNPYIVRNATTFCYRIVDNAREAERDLLERFQRDNGRLPRCNAQV